MKQPDGMRSWLKQADALGEIRTIEGADWDLEIGGVADIVNERGSSPAVLFDSVKGYPKGYRVLVNSLGSTKRLGLSLGMPQNLSSMEFVSEWRRRSKDLKHIPPRVVRDGPVLENIQRGKDVNILIFPDAALVRARRRPIYRHRQRQYYPRSRRRLDQPRHGSGDDS